MSKLLKTVNALFTPIRTMRKIPRGYEWRTEGIQYFGFKYYPRTKDFQDPPYEPAKLFRVQRIKPLKGLSKFDKKILLEFGLLGKASEVAVIKNIPENNQRLYIIKHLVQIAPITFPHGPPTDIAGTYLKENGEMVVKQSLVPAEEKLLLADKFKSNSNTERMDGDTLRRDSRKKWLSGW